MLHAFSGVAGTGTVVSSSIDLSACTITQIEFVEVTLTSDHANAGDLRVRLNSPTPTVSELADRRGCGVGSTCGSYAAGHTFGSVRHLGEPASGNWRLDVSDVDPSLTGNFNSWSIKVYGR